MQHRAAICLTATTLVLLGTSAGPAAADAPQDVSLTGTAVFAPPDYQPSQLVFEAEGALNVAGSWTLPEPKGGAVSIANLTFTPAGGTDSFIVRVHSRRTVDTFDESTCTGYAQEEGHWQMRGGTGIFADLRGHGALAAEATYLGGDPEQNCEGVSEQFTIQLDGALTRR